MIRLFGLTLLAGLCALSTGCAMCCAPLDCDYPCVAGSWVRTNPTSGRVGSLYDPAGGPTGMVEGYVAGTPPQAEEIPASQLPPGQVQSSSPMFAEPPTNLPPGTRSVIPRRMGETYLQTQP